MQSRTIIYRLFWRCEGIRSLSWQRQIHSRLPAVVQYRQLQLVLCHRAIVESVDFEAEDQVCRRCCRSLPMTAADWQVLVSAVDAGWPNSSAVVSAGVDRYWPVFSSTVYWWRPPTTGTVSFWSPVRKSDWTLWLLSQSALVVTSSHLHRRQTSLARTVVKAPKSCHIAPILRSLHGLRITEYKLLSLTYKVLTTTQPPYLHNLISVQRPRSTRSSPVVTLARPPTSSSLKVTDRSFRYASPCLWNQLLLSLRQPYSGISCSISYSSIFHPSLLSLLIHHSAHQ